MITINAEKLLLCLIREKIPTTISSKILSEQPIIPKVPIEYKIEQTIEIVDPRTILSERPPCFDDKPVVQIWRIQRKIPLNSGTIYNFVYQNSLELLKEYTYEEWDSGLVWKEGIGI